jgi:hypothetical protein
MRTTIIGVSIALGLLSATGCKKAPPEQPKDTAGEEARARETAAREREAALKAYADRCDEVARHLGEGKLTDADRATVRQTPFTADMMSFRDGGHAVALLDRIAKKELLPEDFKLIRQLPCGTATRPAFMLAASTSKGAWSTLTDGSVDPDLVLALGASPLTPSVSGVKAEAALSADSKAALHKSAEDAASKTATAKTSADCASALGLCALDGRFGTTPGPKCAAVVQQSARLKKAEDAAAAAAKAADDAKTKADADRAEATRKAEAAAADAKTAACDRETKNWQACNRSCDDNGGGNDDAVMACEDRCNAAHKKPSCN